MQLVIVTGMSGAGKSTAMKMLEDMGYFCADPESRPEKLILNRTVSLKDSWAKINTK